MRFFFLYLFLTLASLFSFIDVTAQQKKHTISGYIKEEATGEFSIGANVYIKELLKGASSNQYGFYSITVDEGNYTLVISYMGFENIEQPIVLDKDLRLNFSIKSKAVTAKEVEITSERSDKNVQSTEMGTVRMDIEQIKKLPAFLGEVDVLKTIQLIPGVKSAGDGNSGFYVRGGGPDQNLVLLDEAVVYNASHLLGFFSVFNGDAIKDINLIKGGMPAQYGGRLASVLDISMKEGNNKKYQVEGGLGLIFSRLTVQGPIKKDTSSFIITARRSYFDVLIKPFIKKTSNVYGSGVYFYDFNTKLNYRLSDKDRLFLSGYFGRDKLTYKDAKAEFSTVIPYGNATSSLRWNHLFNSKLFMNTSAIYSQYNFALTATQSDFEFKLFSGIRDWNGKLDFQYYPTIRHSVKFGVNYIYHTFIPSNASAKQGEVEFDIGKIVKMYAHDAAVYITDDFDLTDRIKINAGLRYSYFQHIGPFDRFVKNSLGQKTDTINYKRGEKIADYGGLEPRAAIRFGIGPRSSIKASFTQNYQYIHLASLSGVSLPTDVWIPSSSIVKPQFGTQYALGYFRNFKDDMFETSVEVYYKTLINQVEYKEGALPEDGVSDNLDYSLTFGNGESYGSEFFIKKVMGKFNGWIGYTLSYTSRTFPDLNNGKTYYAKYDRRHDGSLVLTYELNKKWSFSTVFVYSTGNAITLPTSRYLIEQRVVNEYSERNAFRLDPYHRLDISATLQGKKTEKFESSWNFSVFNVYNRHNPYFIYFDNEGEVSKGTLKIRAWQVSLFPIIPSVTWNFKF